MAPRVEGELHLANEEEVAVSFRILQFPGEGTTRLLRMRAIPEHWSTPSGYSPDIGFLQAWFQDDSNQPGENPINWGAVCGLALSIVASVSFWAGVGALVEHLVH